jgi:hypothetical protein
MGRKLGELSKLLVFISGTESEWNSPSFSFSLLLFALLKFSAFTFPS